MSIALLFVYLCFNTGLAVSLHYCGGKVSSISIGEKQKKCACGKKKMAKSCCKDKTTTLAIDDDQRISQDHNFLPDYTTLIIDQCPYRYTVQAEAALINSNHTRFYVFEHGPPKTPIYIQIRSLLI
jgi:hypothetical protein